MATPAMPSSGARALHPRDVDRLCAIDRAYTGHSRRGFFERRLKAAAVCPNDFILVGVVRGGSLRGYAVARLLRGEFGQADVKAVLDAIGVEPECQERGVGQSLMDELIDIMRRRGVRTLHSQANWADHGLLRFFHACGFELSPRLVLERPVAEPLAEAAAEP